MAGCVLVLAGGALPGRMSGQPREDEGGAGDDAEPAERHAEVSSPDSEPTRHNRMRGIFIYFSGWERGKITQAPILLTFVFWIMCCRHISSVVKGLTVAVLSQQS